MAASSAKEEVHSKRKPKIFYGWWIVLALAAINAFIGGVYFYGFTAFYKPMVDHFGWSYGTTSLLLSLRSIETGLFAPVVGLLVDKLGPRRLMFFGIVVAGFGLILFSRVNSLTTFFVALLIAALGTEFCSGIIVPSTAVANWFRKNIGKAMGLLAVGFGLSGLLVPAVSWLISQYGWQVGFVVIAIGVWVVCLPLSLLVRHKPEHYGYLPDGETAASLAEAKATRAEVTELAEVEYRGKEALKTRAFWLLTIVNALGLISLTPIMYHMRPYLESVDLSWGTASFAVTAMTLLSVAGRIGFGWLGDVVDKRKLLALALALQTMGLLVFSFVHSIWVLILFVILFGPAYGAQAPLRPALQREFFGRSAFGTIQGIISIGTIMTTFIGLPLTGWIYDTRGSYFVAWLALAILTAVAIPLALAMRPPQKTRSAEDHI